MNGSFFFAVSFTHCKQMALWEIFTNAKTHHKQKRTRTTRKYKCSAIFNKCHFYLTYLFFYVCSFSYSFARTFVLFYLRISHLLSWHTIHSQMHKCILAYFIGLFIYGLFACHGSVTHSNEVMFHSSLTTIHRRRRGILQRSKKHRTRYTNDDAPVFYFSFLFSRSARCISLDHIL